MDTKNTKISITGEAEKSMERMFKGVNEGYLGGKVSKTDLVSWIIVEFEKSSFEKSVEDIRKESFDQLRYLESVVKLIKKSRKSGEAVPKIELPMDLNTLTGA